MALDPLQCRALGLHLRGGGRGRGRSRRRLAHDERLRGRRLARQDKIPDCYANPRAQQHSLNAAAARDEDVVPARRRPHNRQAGGRHRPQ